MKILLCLLNCFYFDLTRSIYFYLVKVSTELEGLNSKVVSSFIGWVDFQRLVLYTPEGRCDKMIKELCLVKNAKRKKSTHPFLMRS